MMEVAGDLHDRMFMQQAINQAQTAFERDEVPVGAIIVYENNIIAKAHNQVESLKDPTAHAEMIAVTQAANTLKNKWLYDCCLYVTLEPCSMCAGALLLSRLKRIIFGAYDPKTGACGSVINVLEPGRFNHTIEVVGGYFEEECSRLLRDYFRLKRGEGTAGEFLTG